MSQLIKICRKPWVQLEHITYGIKYTQVKQVRIETIRYTMITTLSTDNCNMLKIGIRKKNKIKGSDKAWVNTYLYV